MRQLLTLLIATCFVATAYGQTNPKVAEMESQRKQLEQQISQSEQLLSTTQKDVDGQLAALAALTAQIKKQQQLVNRLDADIRATDREIKSIEEYRELFKFPIEKYYSDLGFDFEILGHPDLVRKFNVKHPYFDENAGWYLKELEKTADAIAASGKIVEVNTGAISRGWLDDAYPSPSFRAMLRERGVRFILSSDSHAAETIDCAFDRFAGAEDYVDLTEVLKL